MHSGTSSRVIRSGTASLSSACLSPIDAELSIAKSRSIFEILFDVIGIWTTSFVLGLLDAVGRVMHPPTVAIAAHTSAPTQKRTRRSMASSCPPYERTMAAAARVRLSPCRLLAGGRHVRDGVEQLFERERLLEHAVRYRREKRGGARRERAAG